MNSQTVPVRQQSYEDQLAQRIEESRLDLTEALRRTNAIVDRICPAIPLPGFSTRYPELNGSMASWDRHHDNTSRRKALYRAIKPRMDAKVRARQIAPLSQSKDGE